MIPIIVGVSDIKNKSDTTPEDGSDEPMRLMLNAIHLALEDTGIPAQQRKSLQESIDSVSVVRPWSHDYEDLAATIAQNLGVRVKYKEITPHGGNQPAKLVDEAARRVYGGENRVAVVTGGEAIHSLMKHIQKDNFPVPSWTKGGKTPLAAGGLRPPSEANLSGIHGVGAPIQVYPLYENGYRAHYGQTYAQNSDESAQLYAEFAKVAERNPVSWNHGKPAKTKSEIENVDKRNRMICWPYPMLMNAFNNVNLAAACIVTSTDYARQLGIPESKWIYPLGGAGIAEADNFYHRPNFYSSPAISLSIDKGLESSGLTRSDIDLFDFYSCFPIVPKVACKHLGLPTTGQSKPITLLGGLTSFGGAGNNYSMHAITEMTRLLRQGKGKAGLILANGGVMSYQHVLCLSSKPRKSGQYPDRAPLPGYVSELNISGPRFEEKAEGEAVIETFTVDFDRLGNPDRGHIVGRLKSNDHRFIANHADKHTLEELCSKESQVVGRAGWVGSDPEEPNRNIFSFVRSGRSCGVSTPEVFYKNRL